MSDTITSNTRGTGAQASPAASDPGLPQESWVRPGRYSPPPVAGLSQETWVRLPGNGGRLEGLSRAALYRITNDKASGVVSVSITQPGSDRGVRLIGLNSLRAYIARCAENQIAARLAEKGAA